MRYFLTFLLMTIAFTVSAAPLQDGFTDDNSPLLVYAGIWTDSVYTEAYGGSYQSSTNFGASVSFDTFATGFTIFFVYDPLGDDIEICVGLDCTIVSTLGATAIGSIELTGLDSTTKTITVSKVSNDLSVVNLDAIYIHPSRILIASEVNEYTFDFDYEGVGYTGVYDLRITSGEAILAILLTMLLTFKIFQFIVGLWGK